MMFEYVCQTWTFSPYSLAPIFVAVSKINIQHNMMDEKKDKSYKKNFESTAKIIHELTQEEVTISGLPFTEKEGKFVFEESFPSFLLRPKDGQEFFSTFFNGPYWYDSLEVSTKSGSYKISQAHLSFPENPFSSSPVDGCYRCSVQFYQLMDSRWDEKTEYYYRYILPVKDHKWKDLIERPISDYLHISPDHVMPIYWALVRVDFPREGQIHLFQPYYQPYNDTDKSDFLVIESQFPCTHSAMGKYMYPISLSLGLVTSVAPFDYAIVVASKTPEFDGEIMGGIVKLRPTIKSKRRFFTTDIDSLYRSLKGKADYTLHQLCDKNGKAKSRLDPMTEQEFSALARMLHENRALARAALMLIDSSMNLECLGAIYAVALETICSVLIEANKEFLPKHRKKNGEERRRKNEEKLTEPFKLPQIGYELSEEKGKELVDIRNSFLHGGVLGYSHTEYHKLLYPCMKLRCFCGILLLRYAGYKGPILNNAVALGLEEAIENEEPLFITYDEEAAKELVEKRKKEKQKEEEEKKKQSQDKNNTRNQGKEKAPQPTEKPEASV